MNPQMSSFCRFLAVALTCVFNLSQAAEFTWFNNVDGKEGWIEFSTQTSAGQNRIHVFPKLIGADGSDLRAKTEARPDGVYISFVLDNTAPSNATNFVAKVLSAVSGVPEKQSANYQVNVPNISLAEVRVVRDGVTLGKKSYDAKLPSVTVGGIKVTTPDSDLRRALLDGEYQLEADITLPQATYSSLAISIDEKMTTSYKIEALKTIVTQQRTSGGKFFVFDWRRQSARNTVTQTVNETRTSNASRSTSVMSVDADDAMLAKVESLLGFNDLTREKFIQNHLQAAKMAEDAGNMELAKLNRPGFRGGQLV